MLVASAWRWPGVGDGSSMAQTFRLEPEANHVKLVGMGCQGPCRRTALGLGMGSALERLGPVSCTHCCACTSGLSTWWSTTALERDLVLRRVSRLDAFSGYPCRT